MPDHDDSRNLDALGWRHYLDQTDVPRLSGVPGRVRRVDRGEVDVITAEGELRVTSDSQRSQAALAPATGDWVDVVDDPDVGLVVERLLPRATSLVRRDPAEKEVDQVMVANVDLVGIVAGLDRPANVARIERFLVLAQDSGAEALIVLTKTDVGLGEEWVIALTQLADVPIIHTSALESIGIDELRRRIAQDRSLVLLGESGSGKSTLVNALIGQEIQQTTAVRARDAKGRHTTVARELLLVPGGGVLIDTPGIRGVGLWDAEHAVTKVFADITDLGSDCRFNDCSHTVEPDSAVQRAVEVGEIDPLRIGRYLRLRREVDDQAERLEHRRRKPTGRRRRT